MANYATLKAAIEAAIYENHNNEITGQDLQNTLIAMVNSLGVGYQFVDIATPTTNPGTPDQNVFYIAATAGTYSNFGSIVIAENEVAILAYNGIWTKKTTGAASAAQVSQLSQDVGDLEDTVNGVEGGDTVIQYDRNDAVNYSILSNGTWSANNKSIIIPITPGTIYRVSGDGTQGTILGVLHSANIASNVPVDFSVSFPSRIPVQKDETYEFTAPDDATCLSMLIYSSAGNLYPTLKEHVEHKEGLVSLFPRVEQLEGRSYIQDRVLFGDEPRTEKGELSEINLSQFDDVVGTVVSGGVWYGQGKSKLIPTTWMSAVRVIGGETGQVVSFIKNDTLRSGQPVPFATGHSDRDIVLADTIIDFDIPNDCQYLCVTVETTTGDARTPEIHELYFYGNDSISEKLVGESVIIADADMDKKNIYITNEGDVQSGYTSACIPLSVYSKALLNNTSANNTLFYSFLKEEIELGVAPSFATGYVGLISVSPGGQDSVRIPEDALYIYVSINTATYPSVTLSNPGFDERISDLEGETSALTGITVPIDYQEEGDGTSGIGPALNARTGGGKVVIPRGIYGITEQVVIPGRNLNIEGAVWNYPQDPNGVHPSNTGTKLALLTNEIESVFKTRSDMSGMRMSQLGFQGLTTVWDYEDADGNGEDYYFDPSNIKNVGLFIGEGRFDQVSLHRLSFCGLAVGILAKYTIDANVWSEINTDGCDFGIFVDYNSCHHPKIINNILSDCVGAGLYYKTTAEQNSYGLVADGNVLVRNASYLTPAQIAAGIPQASLILIGHRFASVINNTIVLSGVYKRQSGGLNYTAYEGGIGLYFTGDHSVIKGNKIAWSTSKAATISGNYNTISCNVIEDEHDGVSVSGNYNAITGNVFDSVLSVTGNNNRIEGNTHSGAITLSGNNNEIHGGLSDIITVSGNNNVLVGFSSANVTDNGTGTIIK